MNPANSERILKAVKMVVDAGDSIRACDSKTARNNALFSCTVAAGGTGELAVKDGFGGCKMASLGVGGLAWTRITSFMGSTVLGAVVWGVVLEGIA